MKLAISNLAWQAHEEAAIAAALADMDVRGVEIAPSKLWPDPAAVTRAEALECRARWAEYGVEVVAMQSLLFGRPELVLFGSDEARRSLLRHLEAMCRLGSWLGAHALVFGSPRNRHRGSLSLGAAEALAVPFFRGAGAAAANHGVALCIEATPPEYGCDYVTTVEEARALVGSVASPGFALHLDAGGVALAGGGAAGTVRSAAAEALHYHISEPYLAEIGAGGAPHLELGRALRAGGYSGWLSIEMKSTSEHDNLARVRRSVAAAIDAYADGAAV